MIEFLTWNDLELVCGCWSFRRHWRPNSTFAIERNPSSGGFALLFISAIWPVRSIPQQQTVFLLLFCAIHFWIEFFFLPVQSVLFSPIHSEIIRSDFDLRKKRHLTMTDWIFRWFFFPEGIALVFAGIAYFLDTDMLSSPYTSRPFLLSQHFYTNAITGMCFRFFSGLTALVFGQVLTGPGEWLQCSLVLV